MSVGTLYIKLWIVKQSGYYNKDITTRTLQQGYYIYNRELGRVSVSFTRLSSQFTGHYNKDITYIIGSLEE
jgi:hypothetical protein